MSRLSDYFAARKQQLINYYSFDEFARANPDLCDYEDMPMEMLEFRPATMQRVLDALGFTAQQKTAGRN